MQGPPEGPEEWQQHGIQSQSPFVHSLLKLGPPADSCGVAWAQEGHQRWVLRAVPGGMGADRPSVPRGWCTLPWALPEAPSHSREREPRDRRHRPAPPAPLREPLSSSAPRPPPPSPSQAHSYHHRPGPLPTRCWLSGPRAMSTLKQKELGLKGNAVASKFQFSGPIHTGPESIKGGGCLAGDPMARKSPAWKERCWPVAGLA